MRYLPGNAQHIGARSSQQDWFGFADPDNQEFIAHGGFLAIVCDGMGGMEHGDQASRIAVRAFLDAYALKTKEEGIPDALERAVREANSQVVALAHSLGLAEGVGTTLVAATIQGTSMYFVSVGDSGLFHASGGQLQTVNRPHIFANMLEAAVTRGTMSREDADLHPERESLTSFIGTENLEEIDRNVDPWPLRDGDTILLASDGMFKTLAPEEILASLQGNPQKWPEALVARTLGKAREYQDNVTVISVTVESEARARAVVAPTVDLTQPGAKVLAKPAGRDIPKTVKIAAPDAAAPAPVAPPETKFTSGHLPVPAAGTPHAGRPWVWWLVLLLLVAGAAGAWWIVKHKKPAAKPDTAPAHQVQSPPAEPPPPEPGERIAQPEPAPAQTPPARQASPPLHRPAPKEQKPEHREK